VNIELRLRPLQHLQRILLPKRRVGEQLPSPLTNALIGVIRATALMTPTKRPAALPREPMDRLCSSSPHLSAKRFSPSLE